PISNRLTDEAWQTMLQDDAPSLPIWVQSFVDSSMDCTVPSPDHFWGGSGLLTEVEDTLFQSHSKIVVTNPTKLPIEIMYNLPKRCFVSLELYDITGRRVETIFRGWQDEGSYSTTIKGGFPEGIYFLRLTTDGIQNTKKIVILR
ncbi:T9SS type A sorting domain-containing protein, partial [candidate division WOR-3 bacterium]|nr:T9SS type A sorting domain-containing protein [candidate division WOR-3 bacterium]